MANLAKYNVGQIIRHTKHSYRGVIVDIDPVFQPSGKWLPTLTRNDPVSLQPWYRVLVDESAHITYVAEDCLELAENIDPIDNPNLDYFLKPKIDGSYKNKRSLN